MSVDVLAVVSLGIALPQQTKTKQINIAMCITILNFQSCHDRNKLSSLYKWWFKCSNPS